MSPAGRRTDSSHEGNKYGGASPPDSIMLPLGHQVFAAPLTASSDSGFLRLTFGEVDAEELRVQRRVGSTAPRRRGARR